MSPRTATQPSDNTPLVLIDLGNLKPAPGSVKSRERVGRGRASGSGKTCNRGHNGEGQRSGRSSKRGFEGGQMPLYRRIPKFRSFLQLNKRQWLELNVGDLPALMLSEKTKKITYADLAEFGLLKAGMDGLRLLGNGELTVALKVQAHHVTASARAKIEAAGGSVELIEGPVAPQLV
jgi:large subunit ribosomal protein L15